MTTNVRHLRAMPRPYDHERDDIAITVALTPLEWSVLIAGAERSPIADCRSVAARVATEVMRVQRLRFAPTRAPSRCSPGGSTPPQRSLPGSTQPRRGSGPAQPDPRHQSTPPPTEETTP